MKPDPAIIRAWADLRPFGGFDLIMVDPPWSFANWSARGEAKNPSAQYECQPLDWIKALPMDALAAENCLLWLWATNPMLPQALEVMAAWGFSFTTSGTWVKRTKHGKIAFGTGYVLRCASEPFLIGRRGDPKCARTVRSVIEGPVRAHSQKPDEAFAAAEKLMPEARRIEVFSRTTRPGWVAWGDQVNSIPLDVLTG
jgi:N6-adenosine-specific RNA methylase IME4